MMAADTVERTQIGFRGPSSIPLSKNHNTDPSLYVNQLQFNLHAPYSLNSLASNFTKPQPLVIEKFPVFPTTGPSLHPEVDHSLRAPSSPTSSVSSQRLHFAVQLAKVDAKKLWRKQKEVEESESLKQTKSELKQDKRNEKATEVKSTRKMMQDGKKQNVGYVQYKSKKDRDTKRNLREYHVPDAQETVAEEKESAGSEEKQTREIRRLERQIQNYLQRLDGLIHKGQEVIQKRDKRLHVRRNDKDDVSHLSDEDTDPRQYERAEEQATRSARVLYMIERQIRELDDEIRKKGRNMKQSKKSQTLGRLAAAQRATVRALRMLINSAPLQPKRSQHYPSIYQALTSLIQQLSLLATQIEGGDVDYPTRAQTARFDVPLKRRSEQRAITQETRSGLLKKEAKLNGRNAFSQEPDKEFHRFPPSAQGATSTYRPSMQETFPDDSMLTVDPTPERNATLKAGLEALLRTKQTERKNTKPVINPANTKKKSLLLPPALQAKRRKAHAAVQKTVKFPNDTAHFTKETTASRLKKVEKQKTTTKEEMKGRRKDEAYVDQSALPEKADTRTGTERSHEIDHGIHEREIQRQLWLEDESRKKLREVMDIPKSLVSEAEEAIKKKLKPILDQAQAVVDSSKTKPVQARFANIASDVTMKQSEVLSEMILDDLLIDTAQEFQRLERNEENDASFIQDRSTLDNILQRLEQFEKEEESIRRHLNHVSYTDTYVTKQRGVAKKNDREEKGTIFTKSLAESSSVSQPRLNHARNSTAFIQGEKHPVSLFLPSGVRDNIFSYREKYSAYLNQSNAENHGAFDPWQLVERVSDEILEEMILEVATEFTGACDDVTEMIFQSEFMKE